MLVSSSLITNIRYAYLPLLDVVLSASNLRAFSWLESGRRLERVSQSVRSMCERLYIEKGSS